MKHDYTDDEIRSACKDVMSLRAFLEALPMKLSQTTRSAEPAEIARLLDECDKAQGILKACLSVMPFGNIKTHTFENLPGRIADLASEIASLSLENERLEAELAALRQPTQSAQTILADDGRSLGEVFAEKFNIEWGWMTTTIKNSIEAGARDFAAVVLAQAVRRMEAVTEKELHDQYWKGQTYVGTSQAIERIRARLIAAAKGEGQAQPIVVNEPPQHEGQPDLSGESEKQDPYAELKAYAKAGARIRTHDTEWTNDVDWSWCLRPEHYEVHPDDLHMCQEYAPQAEPTQAQPKPAQPWTPDNAKAYEDFQAELRETWAAQPTTSPGWTPAVGDVVRLKSGGPMMTVTHVDPKSLMCAWMNANNELQVEPITTLCLTQVPNP